MTLKDQLLELEVYHPDLVRYKGRSIRQQATESVLKTDVPQGLAGSTPAPSAIMKCPKCGLIESFYDPIGCFITGEDPLIYVSCKCGERLKEIDSGSFNG